MIPGMLDGTIKQRPPYMLGAEVLLLLLGGIILSVLLPFLGPLKATLVSLVGMLLITGMNLVVWSGAGMIMPLASSLLMTITLFALNMSYGYFVESRSKRQFTELFGQYVPPELVDRMAAAAALEDLLSASCILRLRAGAGEQGDDCRDHCE